MNTEILQTFVEVVRCGSYSRAARVLHLSQPAVYQQVRSLERLVNAPLLEMRNKVVMTTPEGRLVLEQAAHVLSETNYLLNSLLLAHQSERKGIVKIIAGGSLAAVVLPHALSEISKRYPLLQLHVAVKTDADDVNEALLRFDYDGGFHSGDRLPVGLMATPIFDDEIVLICPLEHQLCGAGTLEPRDIENERIITYCHPSAIRAQFDEWVATDGVEIRPTIEINSQHAIVMAVMAGAGIGLVTSMTARPYARAGLVSVARTSPPMRRTYRFVRRTNSKVADVLLEICRLINEYVDNGTDSAS